MRPNTPTETLPSRRRCAQMALAAIVLLNAAPAVQAHDVNDAMKKEAEAFLAALTPDQRARAVMPFDSDERANWHFVPRSRKGLPLGEMTEEQRTRAHALLASGLSHRGYEKAASVLALEEVLQALEGPWRDPGRYSFSLFGEPASGGPWGWRVEGHHLSLNFTAANDTYTAVTPFFLGANPAEVQSGPRRGLRVLAAEEDLARDLIHSLDAQQRARAIILTRAPSEIFNVPGRNATEPQGLPAGELSPEQRGLLVQLVKEYLFRCRAEIAEAEWRRIEKAGVERLHFAWAGGLERGQPHYYRVQGGHFVLEYDNTQDGANHVHCVWRDFDRDFGRDVLGEHHRSAHAQP